MVTSRKAYIELIRRQIYGDQPSNDANITIGLCNYWLNYAAAFAAKQNSKENLSLDGVNYINNSFYSTFKGIAITQDEQFLWRLTLPQIPLGVGNTDGISQVIIKDAATNQRSYPVVLMSQNQLSFQKGMMEIPNKLLGYSEGKYIYVLSTILLSEYTASITMVSSGDGTDLTSTVNIPDDYFPIIVQFMREQLMFQRTTPQDVTNDGADVVQTT